MKLSHFFGIVLLLTLQGCRLGPPYEPLSPPVPDEWKAPTTMASAPDVDFWWEVFDDETLNELEQQALGNNPSLYASLERVIQARAYAGVQCSYLYPQLDLLPSYRDSGSLFKPNIPIPAFPGVPAIPKVFRIHQFLYELPLDLSYQVDLWGKLRGRCESAFYTAQAQEEDFQATLLTLTSDLASRYFQLRALDAQIDTLQATVETRRKNTSLNQSRYDQGLVNYTDVSNAAVELSNAEADYFDAVRVRTLHENAIAILIGVPPSCFTLNHNPLINPPPEIPAGVPSAILLQRPDIAAAERNMAAQHALIGVAYASFLPSLELTGILGYSSPDLHNFLRWKSRLWVIGADAAQTIFDAGRNQDNLTIAWSSFREAEDDYRHRVLKAFEEVENALNDLEWQAKQANSLEQSVLGATKTLQLSSRRYYNGLVTYFDVVQSERTKLAAEVQAINLLGARYVATVQLIKALGGGWETSQMDEVDEVDCVDEVD